tara:strand:- start:1146 stop:2879 length:1734 start_codon:yes stop_codon:yes gene_type:complete
MNYLILLVLTLGLYSISVKINDYIFKNKENTIINTFIFSFFFVLIYLINSYSFISNINSEYFSYIFLIITLIICLFQRKEILNYTKIFKSNFNFEDKVIILILIFYFLIILFPVSDEDSLRYHLAIAKKINNGSFYENTWFDYITIGTQEFLSAFALNLKLENFISYTNFLYLIFAIISNIFILKKYKQGSGFFSALILLSCPYLISLMTSQKFYFLPCFIVSYSIAYLYLEKKINTSIIYLILIINIFNVVTKPTFFPYLIFIGAWLFIIMEGYKKKITYLISSFLIIIILYYPIYFIKQKIYSDPFLPYLSINPANIDWFSEYNHWLTNFNMDYTDAIQNIYLKSILIPIKLIVPLTISDLFKTLGVSLLFLFSFNFKKDKYLVLILLFFILSVIILNNYQSRWFLPLLIFISIFGKIDKLNLLKKINYIQLFGVCCIILPISLISLISNISLLDKKIILHKVVSSMQVVEEVNKKYNSQKIFSSLNNQYYFDNIVPIYYPEINRKFDKNYFKRNESDTKLILWRDGLNNTSIKYFVSKNFNCKKYKKIEEFYYTPRRFYFIPERWKVELFRLDC